MKNNRSYSPPSPDHPMRRMHASKLKDTVDKFLESNVQIAQHCKSISETCLMLIDPKRLYQPSEFEADQSAHRAVAAEEIAAHHRRILRALKASYEVFKQDGGDIQQHWRKYVGKVDADIEAALTTMIKKSFQV